MRDWLFDNGGVTCYRPVKEEPLSALTATQRGYIRAIFRAFPGDMERILLELSALRYCSLKTALKSAVRDGCLTEQEAEEHYLDFNQEVAKLPTRSVEYITALASGYNAGVKYKEIAAFVGKSTKTVLNDMYALRNGTTTRHLFKGTGDYGRPADSPFVRVRGPVPEWNKLIETPFSETKEEGAPPEMLPDPRGAKGESPSTGADAARAIDDLEELVNGGAAFLSALPHEDFSAEAEDFSAEAEDCHPERSEGSFSETSGKILRRCAPQNDREDAPQNDRGTLLRMTVTISGGADITIHIKGGNNNV